jgi:hypothetical protein
MSEINTIRVIDMGDFYSVYGVVSLIFIIMLVWFFVRTNIDDTCKICGKHSESMMCPLDKRPITILTVCDKCGSLGCTCKPRKCRVCGLAKCTCGKEAYSSSLTDNSISKLETSLPDTPKSTVEGMFPFETEAVRAQFPELNTPEPQPVTLVESPIKPYNLKKASYGDVPIAFYNMSDAAYGQEWYDGNKALYVPNMRSLYQQTNTPIESMFWDD